ncbi:MAG: MFS transporter [Pseudomonadota bacterium]
MLAELRGYPGKAFFVCLLAYTFSQMDLALFAYAIPSIREEFGLSLSGIMGVVSVAFIIAAVLIAWLGLLTDRLGRRRMFQFSLVGSSFLVALHSVVPNPAALALLRGSSIAVGGLSYPITGAVIAEEFPARYRGFFLGLLQTGYPLGWALASVVAVELLVGFGWRALFLAGLISLPYLLVINRYIREPARAIAAREAAATAGRVRLAELFRGDIWRRVRLLFVAQFLFVWAYAGSVFLFPSFLAEARGLEPAAYASLIGTGHAIGVLGYVLAAWVGEFVLTRRDTVVIWSLLGAAAFQWLVWGTDDYGSTLLAYGVMSMFFYGTAAVKFAYLAELFPTRLRATAMAVCGSVAVTLGSAAGPYCVAKAVEWYGWNSAYSVVVGVPLTAAGILYCFLTRVPSGLEVEQVQAFIEERHRK